MATLALCMIVKNEEFELKACLEPISDDFDEIIIVDTGSTDDTTSIAASYGAKIIDFEWIDDFAAARNAGIEAAASHWIFFMDADERIDSSIVAEMKKLISADKKVAYRLTQRNYLNDSSVSGFVANTGQFEPAKAFEGFYDTKRVRLFPNNLGIRFSGAVHEDVKNSAIQKQLSIEDAPIAIHHLRHRTGEDDREHKEHYLALLQKMIVAQVSADSLFHAGVLEKELKKYDDAIAHFKQCIELDPSRTLAKVELGVCYKLQEQFDDAITVFNEILEEEPATYDALFGLGVCYFKQKKFEDAKKYFVQGSKINFVDHKLYTSLASVYDKLGDIDNAAQTITKAVSLAPKNLNAVFNYAIILEKKGNTKEALAGFTMALKLHHPKKAQIAIKIQQLRHKLTSQ